MYDQIFDREYQAGRAALNDSLGRLITQLTNGASQSMRVLHKINFDAPWKQPASKSRRRAKAA